MKAAILFIAIFALALLIIPMISLSLEVSPLPEVKALEPVHTPVLPVADQSPQTQSEEEAPLPVAEDIPPQQPESAAPVSAEIPVSEHGISSFRILDQTTGRVNEVSVQDFVRGAVASEMPVSFHSEALKAQAVAAHTFALHNHYVQERSPDPYLKGADFAADPTHMKVYTTEAVAKKFYGEKADLYWEKICDAADSVVNYIMEYDDEPIVAAYHAISGGVTEDATNVWSGSAPYLLPAQSDGDYLAPGYESVTQIAASAVRDTLLSEYPDMTLSGDPQDWFSDIEYSDSGYMTSASVGGQILHGSKIRTMFDLRSHNLDITYDDSGFTFTARGYGHGVGLSQYGADYLARQGYTFDEILNVYYSGVQLVSC